MLFEAGEAEGRIGIGVPVTINGDIVVLLDGTSTADVGVPVARDDAVVLNSSGGAVKFMTGVPVTIDVVDALNCSGAAVEATTGG